MFLCNVVENNVCVEWVSYSSLFLLPDGAGVKIGASLFVVSALAFGINFLFRFILNR